MVIDVNTILHSPTQVNIIIAVSESKRNQYEWWFLYSALFMLHIKQNRFSYAFIVNTNLQKPKGLYTMYNLQGTMYNFLTLRSQVVTANEKNRFLEKLNVQS